MLSLVPTELIEEVMDAVALFDDESVTTLKALSQACKLFQDPAQRRLFRSVKLQVAGGSAQLSALYNIITSSPMISGYIQHVYAYYDSKKSPKGLSFDPLLSHLLSELQNITGLHLNFYHRSQHRPADLPCDWDNLSVSLHNALFKALSTPTLVFLKIQGIENMPKTLANFLVSIPTVILETTSFQSNSSPGITPNYSRGTIVFPERRLRNLTVFSRTNGDSEGALVDTLRSHNINLEKIHFRSPLDVPMISNILRQHGRLLTSLTYDYDGTMRWTGEDQSCDIAINQFPRLQTVKLSASLLGGTSLLDHIIRYLATASTSSKVKVVGLNLIYNLLPENLSDEWITLDALLSGEKYKHLTTVNIYPHKWFIDATTDEKDDLVTLMREALPTLHEKGLVHIFPVINVGYPF